MPARQYRSAVKTEQKKPVLHAGMQDSSMDPAIPRHGLAFCSYASSLIPADVGVFVYQNEILVRSYYTYEGNDIPIALYPSNLDFPILPVDSASLLTIIARVLV